MPFRLGNLTNDLLEEFDEQAQIKSSSEKEIRQLNFMIILLLKSRINTV